MDVSIFDIPHLRDSIASFLTLNVLTRCALVCKDWQTLFTPYLYQTLDGKDKSRPTPEGFQRNATHLRAIFVIPKDLLSSWYLFPNLQSIEHAPGWASPSEEGRVLRLVQSSNSLQSLTVTLTLSRESILAQLLYAMRSLPLLKKLDLTCYQATPATSIQQIIQTCAQFESLRLSLGRESPLEGCGITDAEEESQCLAARIVMDRMQPTRLRELSIRLSRAQQEPAILLPLLEQSPLLETLGLQWVHDPKTLPQITGILEAGKCPQLKNIWFGGAVEWNSGDETIAAFFTAIGRDCNEDTSRINGRGGLESFTAAVSAPFKRQSVLALTQQHAKTLTVLHLMNLRQVVMKHFVDLVSGLPKLESFTVPLWLKFADEAMPEEIVAMLQTPWVCLGLKELDIGLSTSFEAPIEARQEAGDGTLTDHCMDYIFSQIGRLVELREWKLMQWVDLLSVESGYLSRLPNLKKLRGLDLTACRNAQIGIAEAEWMIEHWPRLVHLALSSGSKHGGGGVELPFKTASRRLLAMRPWMTVT